MAMTRRTQAARSYLIELHIRGILHLRIERLPRWLVSAPAAALSAGIGSYMLARRWRQPGVIFVGQWR
jgi:hypothetical protein